MSAPTDRSARRTSTGVAGASEPTRTGSADSNGAEAKAVGVRLSRARAALGLEIDEVSTRTCIRASVLRRMEENDFAACGRQLLRAGSAADARRGAADERR